jgi:putative component of toxin-antitoxin plasmid stabilization module
MEITPMNMQVLDTRRDAGGGYRVDVNRGERVGRVNLCHRTA